jgi:hypothetical protein
MSLAESTIGHLRCDDHWTTASCKPRSLQRKCPLSAHPDLVPRRQLDFLEIVAGAGAVDDEEEALGVEGEQEGVPDALSIMDALVRLSGTA